jgi:hypothetical protein
MAYLLIKRNLGGGQELTIASEPVDKLSYVKVFGKDADGNFVIWHDPIGDREDPTAKKSAKRKIGGSTAATAEGATHTEPTHAVERTRRTQNRARGTKSPRVDKGTGKGGPSRSGRKSASDRTKSAPITASTKRVAAHDGTATDSSAATRKTGSATETE